MIIHAADRKRAGMGRKYYKAEISFNDKNYEIICSTLYLKGISTILEDNGTLQVYVNEDEKDRLIFIKKKLISDKIVNEKDFFIGEFKDRNWNDEWKDSIEPIFIKDKLIVAPSWKINSLRNFNDKIIIQIDPKMSFGTGHNETTQMMLDLMVDHLDIKDKYMLDYGCGTAVLAIAGIKLGVEKAVAIDTDIDSIFNAEENAVNNNVNEKIIIRKANIDDIKEKNFDFIAANIDMKVITANMGYINEKLKKKGKLIITGILIEELDEIKDSLKNNGFKLIETRIKAEWISFYSIKK